MGRLISKLIRPSVERHLDTFPRSVEQAERDPGVLTGPNITEGGGYLEAPAELEKWVTSSELRTPE
jgi:hypothetical protein